MNSPRLFRVRPKISPSSSYGRFGTAFAETDLDHYETTIVDLMSGQHSDPLRVVTFNTDTDRTEVVARQRAGNIAPP